MHTPRHRTTRTLRTRVTNKRKQRLAHNIHLGKHGVTIDGTQFPYHVEPDIDVHSHVGRIHTVSIGIYADTVTIDEQLPENATITHTIHG